MTAPGETVKVVLLGESGVGKSSLALRFVTNEFRPYSESTIGASFMSKTVELEENVLKEGETDENASSRKRRIAFKIWDTAGEEKYHSLAPMYYRGAGAAILVFDMCNQATFRTLQQWVDELRDRGPPEIVLAICANKSDLFIHRQVKAEDAAAFAEEVGAFYIETSARDHKNVHELFQEVARRVPSNLDGGSTGSAAGGLGGLDLRYREASANSNSCC